jgi:glycogen operon protein
MDYTGCGNTFNMRNPRVLQLIMDSLRYWIQVMHIDGFRFDLASTLARELHEVDRLSSFFDIIQQDPVISRVKLIAEPWDLGAGGYQVGNFPALWSEWNGKYRDSMRHFWKGDGGYVAEFATRFTGSSDLYEWSSRRPHASVNFVTCHDGFTLNDLVSYDHKHNEANGEENRDGSDDNISWNCGVEGPTDDPAIKALREKKKRNFLATLLFSQGVPMLLAGDEIGHTQQGNNNAYCQDNELTWLNWELNDDQQSLLRFVRRAIRIFHKEPVFHRRRFFHGRAIHGEEAPDIVWFDPAGKRMSEDAWKASFVRSLGVQLFGGKIDVDEQGEWINGDTLLILFNADHSNSIEFTLPPTGNEHPWELLLDTARDIVCANSDEPERVESTFVLQACSMVVLRSRVDTEEETL